MTIERFGSWGSPDTDDADTEVVADDAALAAAASAARKNSVDPVRLGVTSGDVMRTLGLDGPRPAGERHRYLLDLVLAQAVDVNGEPVGGAFPFVAHALAGRPLGFRWSCVAVNTPWLGDWRLGPRAHPNDGLVDVTTGSIPPGQLPEARRRVKAGSHLPHPGLQHRRVAELTVTFPRLMPVVLDGRRVGRWQGAKFTVEPDAIVLVM